MNKKIFILFRYAALCILLFVFFTTIGVAIFSYYKPEITIGFLQTLVQPISPTPIAMKGVAIISDSQSDEYRANDNRGSNYPLTTLNWVELLAKNRNLNFGEWGEWEEPRRTGYAHNWSRTGAAVGHLAEGGYISGVTEQVKAGKVNVVIIFIGANDFSPMMGESGYETFYNGPVSEAAKKKKVNTVVSQIKNAVYSIQDAGDVRILIVKIPDWGNHIAIKVAYPLPQQRLLVTEIINMTNDEIQKFAEEENLLTMDLNEFYKELFGKNDERELLVDEVKIEKVSINNDPHNFYLDDGVHAGTVVSGLLANAIIEELNPVLTNKIKPFSEKELREAAGL